MGYPDRAAEIDILDTHGAHRPGGVAAAGRVGRPTSTPWPPLAAAIHVAASLKGYIVDLAEATRRHPRLALGMSPRAALGLLRAARARAAVAGRDYVVPDDLKALALPVLEHRLALDRRRPAAGREPGRHPPVGAGHRSPVPSTR